MDISKFKLLLDIADTQNLTLSAERLGYTQSGVSHAIHKLELEMGISLLNRTNKGVEISTEGQLILPHMRTVIDNYDRLNTVLDSIHGLQRGSICIGTYSSIAAQWLPAVIKEFQEAYPNIGITVREGGIDDVEQWLYNGVIDFGFLSWRRNQKFNFFSLARDPLYVVAAKDYPLPDAYADSFPVKALEDYPFIASESGIDRDVSTVLETAGINPVVACSCSDDHTIVSMVSQGLGVSLLPSMFLTGQEDRLKMISLNPCSMRTLGICTISERSQSLATKTFIKIAKKVIAELVADSPTC